MKSLISNSLIKKVRNILPILGITLFIKILNEYDLVEVIKTVQTSDTTFIMAAFLLSIPIISLQVTKWDRLLKSQKIYLPFLLLTKIHLIGAFFGSVTPSKIGTFIRIKYIKKYTDKSYSSSSPSIVMDKIIELTTIFFIATLFFRQQNTFIPLILTAFVLAFLLKERYFRNVIVSLLPDTIHKTIQKYKPIYEEFFTVEHQFITILQTILQNLLVWILSFSRTFLLSKALGIEIPFLSFIAIMAITVAINMFPISISGVGTREATYLFLFSQYSLDPSRILALSLLGYAVVILPISLLGLMLFIQEEENNLLSSFSKKKLLK